MNSDNPKQRFLTTLGKRVRDLRLEKGITQVELANSVGKDQQSIGRLESGRINPSIYYLTEIAEGLNVSLEEILKFKNNK